LATLAQHSDLGGGMAIAMKDLEIRGAGNLLGGEQSGHIADVGFDLYVRLVGEAVHEFRGDAPAELNEVRIELPVDAHLPHGYIPSERLRLEMYKRLAEVRAVDVEDDEAAEHEEEVHAGMAEAGDAGPCGMAEVLRQGEGTLPVIQHDEQGGDAARRLKAEQRAGQARLLYDAFSMLRVSNNCKFYSIWKPIVSR
jgi:hypothetical protein